MKAGGGEEVSAELDASRCDSFRVLQSAENVLNEVAAMTTDRFGPISA